MPSRVRQSKGTPAARRKLSPRVSSPRKGVKWSAYILFALVVVAVVGFVATAGHGKEEAEASHRLTPGSKKLMDVRMPPGQRNELIPYTGMTISFNDDTHQPNYVAWELLESEVDGETGREPGFLVDPSVDACALPEDYRHSGFDRGHMAPAGDMKWHPQAMRESFYMTNICPQASDLNRGAWKKLEEKCRQRALADSALIIICGPIFDKSGPAARIGATGVAVPQRFFKVILAPYAENPWAIGFIMPNGYVAGGMQKAAVSVDAVEEATGYDFFAALPDDVEAAVESRCDFNAFSHIRKRK